MAHLNLDDSQPTAPPSSAAYYTMNQQENNDHASGRRKELIQNSGGTRTQIENLETFSHDPQDGLHTDLKSSTATRSQHRRHEGPLSRAPRSRLSHWARESHQEAPSSAYVQTSTERNTNMTRHYAYIESQNKELRNQIKRDQAALTSLREKLAESKAQNANLQDHLEEASKTIFRLQPQRQEYTETEIEEDYRKLTMLVKNWINVNCESFVDNDLCGFDTIVTHTSDSAACNKKFETFVLQYQSEPSRWINAKEHVLVAAVMQFLVDQILNSDFSLLLDRRERAFLNYIQDSIELQADLLTNRTWRSDTIAAINSHKHFMERENSICWRLTKMLYEILQRTLSNEHSESLIRSLYQSIILPAMDLAEKFCTHQNFSRLELNAADTSKTQSASSIWTFEYSGHEESKPGEFGSKLPEFLANIHQFRCVNMSNRGKWLKPTTELITEEQQENLLYVMDIFPGLYCQRVTAGNLLPRSTISQPVLLVAFGQKHSRAQTQWCHSKPVDPEATEQNREPSPTQADSKGHGLMQNFGRFLKGE